MDERWSPMSARRAFLIHLRADCDFSRGRIPGRAEHVASGQVEHFAGEAQLWAFVFRMLEDLKVRPDEAASASIGDQRVGGADRERRAPKDESKDTNSGPGLTGRRF
jgi:rhodanese-related sulfurtransferase